MSLPMHCHSILIWLLLSLVLMTSRGQPCCSGYVLHSSEPRVMSGMLLWKLHVLETVDLLCVMVWYVALSGNKVRLVVPDDNDLCTELFMLHHDSPLAGHLGLY